MGDEVYSIRMNTRTNWKYGYFEARLKLPKGKGTWPAFWMLPDPFTSWPDGGEIDIMEEVGYDPDVYKRQLLVHIWVVIVIILSIWIVLILMLLMACLMKDK